MIPTDQFSFLLPAPHGKVFSSNDFSDPELPYRVQDIDGEWVAVRVLEGEVIENGQWARVKVECPQGVAVNVDTLELDPSAT